MKIQEAFEQNLKFISSSALDAGVMERQFVNSGRHAFITAGTVNLPSGKIRVGDPLTYMSSGRFSPRPDRDVAPGEYPVELSVVKSVVAGLRICTARIKFKPTKAEKYELVRPADGTEAAKLADGAMTGFPVDAGMMAFISEEGFEDYVSFIDKWHKDNPGGNHYDDYFQAVLAESYEQNPEYQREGGDLAAWTVPGPENRMVMAASGFGDGFYQCYWGIDNSGEICELAAPMINADILDKADEDYLKIWDEPEYLCIATEHVINGEPIGYICREEPSEKFPDTGWRIYGRDENDSYWNDPSNFKITDIHGIAEDYPDMAPLLKSPVGAAYFCVDDGKFIPDKGE